MRCPGRRRSWTTMSHSLMSSMRIGCSGTLRRCDEDAPDRQLVFPSDFPTRARMSHAEGEPTDVSPSPGEYNVAVVKGSRSLLLRPFASWQGAVLALMIAVVACRAASATCCGPSSSCS